MQRTLSLVAVLLLAGAAIGQVNYPDFSTTVGLDLIGSAAQNGVELQITPAVISSRGAAWTSAPIPVAGGIDTAFQFRITQQASGGGDGFAFVIQNDPRQTAALGNHASALGYGKFPTTGPGTAIANSLAIEFDTFLSNAFGDISGNEISIHTNGTGENDQNELFSIAQVNAPSNMSDGAIHTVRIRYVPGTLQVYYDNLVTPLITVPYDLGTGGIHVNNGNAPVGGLSLLPGGMAFVGFTGSCGGAWQDQAILRWQTAPYDFQVNQPGASLTMNGAADPGFLAPIRNLVATGQVSTLDLSSTNAALPWDLAFTLGEGPAGLSGAGFATAGGQVLNLNIASPGLGFLNGGALPNLTTSSWPGTPLSFPVALGIPLRIGAQMVVIDFAQADGFSLSHAVDYEIVACPTLENFDSLNTGTGVYPIGWTNGGGTSQWAVASGPTTSAGTGPLTGAFSGANYLYCETSTTAGTTFIVDTCNVSTAALTNFALEFRLSRLGATIGTLNVYQDDGTGSFPTLLATYVGAEPTGADWTLESLIFAPTGPNVRFRFEYTSGTSFTGDLALDDVSVL